MSPLDALWHLLNLLSPALGLGLIGTLLAKLVFWRSLRGVSWARLALWSCGAAALALVVGLVAFGSDGKMITYAAMVLAVALALLWAGWGRGAHG